MNEKKYNKFDAINVTLLSKLAAVDKALLIELIMRCDEDWYCYPSVQRLCQVRGIKHEKNFKGAEALLPGLVKTSKRGRGKGYTLSIEAIMALEPAEVILKHTPATTGKAPAREGENTPSVADDAPSVAENDPSEQGAYNTRDTTRENTSDSTRENTQVDAKASTLATSLTEDSLYSPLPSVTRDLSSCWDDQTSERTGGSAAALEDKGHLVPSGGSVWDDDEVEW